MKIQNQSTNIFEITFSENRIVIKEEFDKLKVLFLNKNDNAQLYLLPSSANSFRIGSLSEKPDSFLISRIGSERELSIKKDKISFEAYSFEFNIQIQHGLLYVSIEHDALSLEPVSENAFNILFDEYIED